MPVIPLNFSIIFGEVALVDYELCDWDPARCNLSPGTRIKAMVINILTEGYPLYKVEKFYERQDVENFKG